MRVVQHKTPQKEEKAPPAKPTEEEVEEFGEDKEKKKSGNMVISGAKIGESEAYPKEAVQAYHEKPQPTHQVGANTKPKIIQQPKK